MRYISLVLLFICTMVSATQSSSLFNQHKYKEKTADHRAYRVGDTVTILVIETAHASASAGSAGDSEFGIGIDAAANQKNWQYGMGIKGKNEGNASTQRRGTIRAQITAVVTKIDENGNLIIKGQQSLTIDGEQQVIELQGRARRSDITSDNTMLSSRLFDAQIVFKGEGIVSEGKEQGIFSRLFKWLGLK